MQTTTIDRRRESSMRMPVDLMVELAHDGFDEVFEADAVDVSERGMRLRAQVLPDVGEKLQCRFAVPATGETRHAEGEVVWTDTTRSRFGEFGLRFDASDPIVREAVRRWMASDLGVATYGDRDDLLSTRDEGSAPDADDSGEFVLRSNDTESESRRKTVAAPVVKSRGIAAVRLDGVASPIEAEVMLRDELRLVVEQPLPFLELGRGAAVDGDAGVERRRLERVALRVEGGVPRLVLELVAVLTLADSIDDSIDEELEARADVHARPTLDATLDEGASLDRMAITDHTASEVDAMSAVAPEPAELDEPASPIVRALAPREVSTREAREVRVPRPSRRPIIEDDASESDEVAATPVGTVAELRAVEKAARARKLDEVRQMFLEGGADIGDGPHPERVTEETPDLATRLAALSGTARERFAQLIVAAKVSVAAFITAVGPRANALIAQALGLFARAVELLRSRAPGIAARFGAMKKRRTTAPPERTTTSPVRRTQRGVAPKQTEQKRAVPVRAIATGVVAVLAVGAGAYALGSTSPAETPVTLHREVAARPTSTAGSATPSPAVADPSAEPGAAPVVIGGAPTTEPTTTTTTAAPAPAAVPVALPSGQGYDRAMAEPTSTAGRLPVPGYPSIAPATATSATAPAATPAPTAAASTTTAGGTSFGAASLTGGRTTTLHMSAPITGLEGVAHADGFTVTVRGALSLDRAAPIAASNPSVDRASILNRGDHSVLDVRFVPGRTPQYRVEVRGQAVEVSIAR